MRSRFGGIFALWVFFLVAASLPGFAQAGDQTVLTTMGFTPVSTPQKAPDFRLPDLQGNSWEIGKLKGKVLLLNFWATWCAPCRQEMPSIERLYERFGDHSNFQILAVDLQEGSKLVGSFLNKNGYRFPVVIDSSGDVATRYSAETLPLSVLVDAEGNLLGYKVGRTDWSSTTVLKGILTLVSN